MMPKKTTKKSSNSPPKSSEKVTTAKSSKKASTKAKEEKIAKVTELYNSDSIYCQFDITNYEKSIKFYKEILEWNPSKFSSSSPDPERIGWFEFELPLKGAFLGLGKAEVGRVTPSRSLVISVKDLEEFKKTMESKNAKPSDITDVPNMISFLTVNDPDNNAIMFISQPRVKS